MPRARFPAQLTLQLLDRVEQLERLKRGLHAHARVEEARLVGQLAHRVGVIGRGAREHAHAGRRHPIDGRLQVESSEGSGTTLVAEVPLR